MKLQTILLCGCLCLLFTASWGQASSLELKASVDYKELRLEDALMDLNKKYGLKFCYSSNYIPLNKKVSISLAFQPIRLILDALFLNTDVIYFTEGDQVILQRKKKKKKRSKLTGKLNQREREKKQDRSLGSLSNSPKAKLVKSKTAFPSLKREENKAKKPAEKTYANLVSKKEMTKSDASLNTSSKPSTALVETPKQAKRWKKSIKHLSYLDIELKEKNKNYSSWSLPEIEEQPKEVLGQVSILPFLSTNYKNTAEITNKISYNILWGHNGGVDGFEAGGLVNSIKQDVKGVQLAGLGNVVGGDLNGTQVSGLFNKTMGKAKGVQGAGLVNLANDSEALQVAGLGNLTEGDFSGVQISGLGNIASENTEGTQVAGLFNISKSGNAKAQISSFFNLAEDVSRGQISVFFNKAKKVDGFQFALINICDTISGPSIGLFNFVKRGGYNRFEISAGADLHLTGSYKFGSRYLYNIVQIGANWNQYGTSWTLGYGFGHVIPLKEKSHVNLELVVSQVNENESWSSGLNLLSQIRGTYDYKIANDFSFFIGPSINVSISNKIQEVAPYEFGSSIAPYDLLNNTSGPVFVEPEETIDAKAVSVKLWIGVNTGIRF